KRNLWLLNKALCWHTNPWRCKPRSRIGLICRGSCTSLNEALIVHGLVGNTSVCVGELIFFAYRHRALEVPGEGFPNRVWELGDNDDERFEPERRNALRRFVAAFLP